MRMKSPHEPKPINIPDDLAARCTGPDQFERFEKLFRAYIAVPHEEIVKEEEKWKRTRARKKARER
jgi:hypothetical protein